MISIHDIHQKYIQKLLKQKQIYKNILVDILTKIDKKANSKQMNLIYRIPIVIVGETEYNSLTCMNYVIKKIIKQGFFCCHHVDNYIYIDWSMIKNEEYIKYKKNANKNNEKKVKFITYNN